MSRAVELVHQWTCGPLTPEEEAELGALLAAGGEESQKALELLQIEAMLRGELLELDVAPSVVSEIQRHEADDAARRVLVRIAEKEEPSQPVSRVGRRRRKPALVALAVVAATLLVIGGVTWTLVRPTESREPLIAEGKVQIETAEGFVDYGGKGLPFGKKIATVENDNTRVRLDDGSDVTIGSHTVLAFVREDSTVRVELSEGRIVAQVTKQQPGKPFAVRTPNFVVEVVGTRFSVTHEAGLSTVDVEEGAVDVLFSGAGRRQRLAAGEKLTASESGVLDEPISQPIPQDWHENFEPTDLAAWWATGERADPSDAPAGNGSQGCLKASPERDAYYQRDLLVATMDEADGLFQCDESLVFRFRYYGAPSCGWIGIWMQAASGKKYFLPVKSTLGTWQSAQVRLQDARSSEGGNDAPIPSGAVIQVLKFQAGRTADDAAFYIDDLSINRVPPGTGR